MRIRNTEKKILLRISWENPEVVELTWKVARQLVPGLHQVRRVLRQPGKPQPEGLWGAGRRGAPAWSTEQNTKRFFLSISLKYWTEYKEILPVYQPEVLNRIQRDSSCLSAWSRYWTEYKEILPVYIRKETCIIPTNYGTAWKHWAEIGLERDSQWSTDVIGVE